MAEILDVVDLEALRKEVREKYREVAEDPTAEYHFHTGRPHAIRLGYPTAPLDQLPDYACEAFAGVGNPFFWGGPKPGERVVDLGSGAGMDSFLAALWVGSEGHVIGVDMTPEMLNRSRSMAARLGLDNVEFREGVSKICRSRMAGRTSSSQMGSSTSAQTRSAFTDRSTGCSGLAGG